LALKKVSNQVEVFLKPLVEVQNKYLEEVKEDKDYQSYLKGYNEVQKLGDGSKLIDYNIENKYLTKGYQKREQEFQDLLNEDADIELPTLTEEKHPDLYDQELSNKEWEVLSLILETD
jgi:ATP/maltotriose-dependent transcriptional regulator MalT